MSLLAFLGVMAFTGGVLSLAGLLADAGERLERWCARRAQQRINDSLRVPRRSCAFRDGTITQ
jgi:hypothetical protein